MGIFTIGHSTRTQEEVGALLKKYSIDTLVDIRSYPSSKHQPQWNKYAINENKLGVKYVWIKELGGRRSKQKVDPDINGAWTHPSFHNYADFIQTKEFEVGLNKLLNIPNRVAYMCSEAVWWKCHRRIVSDVLEVKGYEVYHIMDDGLSRHKISEFSEVTDGIITYPSKQLTLVR